MKIGTYRISKEGLSDYLIEMLEDLSGDIYKEDFKYACESVIKNYKHFTDSK